MKKQNSTIRKMIAKISFGFITLVSLYLTSCSKNGTEPEPDPVAPVNNEMYINFNGKKLICRVPAVRYETSIGTLKDTVFEWRGNFPTGAGGDTTIQIAHNGPRSVTAKYKPNIGLNLDEVRITLKWSDILGAPNIAFDGGDYSLERINGKWVSTMKNGVGYDVKNKTKRYTGVEFRMIWPDLK